MEEVKLEKLDTQSESLTDKLELIESNLWIEDKITAVSDDVRRVFIKIRSLDRKNWEISDKVKEDYTKILNLYDSYLEQGITDIQDYYSFSQKILSVLKDLKTEEGEAIIDIEIDWWRIESTIALYEWVKKALKKIYKELENSLKLLLSPEDWKNLVLWLYEVAKHPKVFMENIVGMLKDYGGDIYRDFELLTENITAKWYAVEMSQFVPETGIPLVIWFIGPGKFLKWLKIVDKLPKWLIKKIEEVSELGSHSKLESKITKLVGIRAMSFDINTSLEHGAEFVEKFAQYIDIDYLIEDPARFNHFINITRDMSKYMIENAWDIKKLPAGKLQDYKIWFTDVMKKIEKMKDRKTDLSMQQIISLQSLRKNHLHKAYYAVVATTKKI